MFVWNIPFQNVNWDAVYSVLYGVLMIVIDGGTFWVHVDRYKWFRNDMPGIFDVENGIRCNLSSHASYSDIMEFVRSVEPEFVLTDSSRSGCADMLAEKIREELHIEAVASHVKPAVN